jgi:hypothetical protein
MEGIEELCSKVELSEFLEPGTCHCSALVVDFD